MDNSKDLDRKLKELGFTKGCLLKLKSKKGFWKGVAIHMVEDVYDENTKRMKKWARGEDIHTIPASTILMFLGTTNMEVEVTTVHKKECNDMTIRKGKHTVICFLHEQQILWWDPVSLSDGLKELMEKFEIVSKDEAHGNIA